MTNENIMVFWQRFRRHKLGLIGIGIFLIIGFCAVTADIIAPYPWEYSEMIQDSGPTPGTESQYGLPPFSWNELGNRFHLLGTDVVGHDIFTGLLKGAQFALFITILGMIIATAIGIVLGMIAGYFSGKIDELIMRFSELFIGISRLILILFFVAVFENIMLSNEIATLIVLSLIFGLTGWVSVSRATRTLFLSFKEQNHSASNPVSSLNFLKSLLFNELGPIIAIGMAEIILFGSVLTFIGFGNHTIASWGRMLQLSQIGLRFAWWSVVFPGLAIFFSVLALHLIGDALKEMIDSQRRQKEKSVTL
ncbi:MAG: ABC transporter permease [Promethearchaeota archaeon]